MAKKIDKIKQTGNNLIKRIPEDKKGKNRFYILLISLIIILDYLIICVHIDKNVFDIFPQFPAFVEKTEIEIFLPSFDAQKIIKEKRSISQFKDDERFVQYLFNTIVTGSRFENTSMIVPLDLMVRKVWFHSEKGKEGKICAIDIEPSFQKREVAVIPGSEERFREAVGLTIKKYIPSVSEVVIMIKGIPGKKLWYDRES